MSLRGESNDRREFDSKKQSVGFWLSPRDCFASLRSARNDGGIKSFESFSLLHRLPIMTGEPTDKILAHDEGALRSLQEFLAIVRQLRQECPWDRDQRSEERRVGKEGR